MMRFLLAALLSLLALPALASGPNVLELRHSYQEAEASPAVAEYKKQLGQATAAEMAAKNAHGDIQDQMRAANEKYMQDSRGAPPISPEDYWQSIQSSQNRFNNLNTRLSDNNAQMAEAHRAVKSARQQLRLAVAQAAIDNDHYPAFIAEGTAWIEKEKNPDLEMVIMLRDLSGKKFQLHTPQRIDKLNSSICNFWPAWGEIWAIKEPETTSKPDANPVVLKVASLNQVFLMDRAVSEGCPFGKVVLPAPPPKKK